MKHYGIHDLEKAQISERTSVYHCGVDMRATSLEPECQ